MLNLRFLTAIVLLTGALVVLEACRSDGDKASASSKATPDVAERAPPVERTSAASPPPDRPEPPPKPEPAERASGGGGGGHGW